MGSILRNAHHVHLIGIGGIGISALARLLVHEGKKVTGTNDSKSPQTLDWLRAQGVEINIGTDPSLLPRYADAFIYSTAWEKNAPRMIEAAREHRMPVFTYFEALGDVSKGYQTIAIAGTHGKTTTTAMTAHALIASGLDPTVIVGSLVPEWQSNFRAGESKWFLVEACEYERSFTHLSPSLFAITNIEEDHLDYYKDLADIERAFGEVASAVPHDGAIVCNPASESVERSLRGLKIRVIDYLEYEPRIPKLAVPGKHNRQNAAIALAITEIMGGDAHKATQALAEFSGTWRRFEYKGVTKGGALVYDDYAHHPSEIEATIRGARERHPDKEIVAVFQPHLYSRTKQLFDGFVRALALADRVMVLPIYAAREKDPGDISSERLVEALCATHKKASFAETFAVAHKKLTVLAGAGSIILIMGAGDSTELAEKIVSNDCAA